MPSAGDLLAVFDSGVGGLTVAGALRRLLPAERILYLGDTARVPYGGKSRETIERYSTEIADYLVGEGAKMVVVACNTASALALDALQKKCPVPVVGVIEPGVAAALEATRCGHVAVIGTKATIGSDAYGRALRAGRPGIKVTGTACPLLVPLIEEGLLDDEVTDKILARYLVPVREAGADTLVLGCTHYPLLAAAIAKIAGPELALVDSAENCARAVGRLLEERGLLAPSGRAGSLQICFTDPPDRFLRVAGQALGLPTEDIEVRRVPHLGN